MTSTNDGKDVKSIQTSGQKGKTYYIELYKSLEAALGSECKLCERNKYLCEAWRRVYTLCLHSLPSTQAHLLSWLQRHTSKTVLQTEWQSPTSKDEHTRLHEAIHDFISECQNEVDKAAESPPWQTQLVQRGLWFQRILSNPWGHPVLKKLLDSQIEPPSDVEVLEWLKEERGVMFLTRLRQLAASKCDDLALALASAVMDRVRATTDLVPDADQIEDVKDKPKPERSLPTFADILKTEAGFTVDVWELLVDIEFVLLHKGDKRSRCIQLAKQTPLRNGYQLVERLNSRLDTSPKEKKLWKNAKDVATLIAQVVVARCMVVRGCGGGVRSALYCCARALARLVPARRLVGVAAGLAAPAATARHLHTLAAAVHAELKSSEEMIPFMCELYVRAITAGMNELERLKLKTEMEAEARLAEQTLASWFTQLGTLLSSSDRIQCECTLTAFSVHPSPAMYEKIKAAPTLPPVALDHLEPKEETTSEFGSWASDSRTKTNFVKTSETLNLKQTLHQANVLSTAILTEGEGLGLGPELCQDIAVLLSGPRLKTLSWDMDRELLLENCRGYMERTNYGTRAVTTELKYLNLDPKAFQHLPEEEDNENDMFYGIEKGYEHLVEFQEPDEIWDDTLLHQEIVDSPYTSSFDSEVSTARRKKKSKKIIDSSEEDSDPLSFMAEAKKKEAKKVRPHSKERSKERRKKKSTGDPLESRDGSQDGRKEGSKNKEKKKDKKIRKKEGRQTQPRSLAHLVGMRVTNLADKNKDIQMGSMTDSDYDSQGKSSLNSLNSEGNDDVVFDGLYSMDELKSPEGNLQGDKMGLLKNNEFSISDGIVAVNKPTTKFIDIDNNAMSTYNLGSGVTSALDMSTSQPYLSTVREEVKKSISRLIEFRRNKNAMRPVSALVPTTSSLLKPNACIPSSRMPNAIVRPQSPFPAQICPKIVTIPDIPKMYINKKRSDQISLLKSEVGEYIQNDSEVATIKPVPYAGGKHDTEKHKILNSTVMSASNYDPVAEIIRRHNINITNNLPPPRTMNMLGDNIKQTNQAYNISSTHNVQKPANTSNAAKQKNFQEFLKELHESINAGAGVKDAARVTPIQNSYPRKEIKPMSRPTPIIPMNMKIDSKVVQSAKSQMQPKKLDTSLNTFSRLNYMHKNKESDSKLQKVVNALIEYQYQNLNKLPAPKGIGRVVTDQKAIKFKCPQSKNETQIEPVKNTPVTKFNNHVLNMNHKVEKPIPVVTQSTNACPIYLSQNSQTTAFTRVPVEIKNEVQKNILQTHHAQVRPEPKPSSLSEKDQNDLVLLLRQQNKLNASYAQGNPNMMHNRDIAQISVSNSGIPSNKFNAITDMPPSNKDLKMSKSTHENYKPKKSTSFRGVKVQNAPVTTSKPLHTKPNTSRNHSKSDILGHNNTKKTELKQENKLNNKNDTPNSKITKTATDWEKVMDAILAHKTPSRGPKALDVALNKSSFAKAFSDSLREQKILKSTSLTDLSGNKGADSKRHSQSKEASRATSPANKHQDSSSNSVPKKASSRKSSTESKQTSKNKTKSASSDTTKKPHVVDVTKKTNNNEPQRKLSAEEMQKQFTCPLPKGDDPFISGIANSDYDLLEELMDDDLRQEIGELSSDEDNFNALNPNASKKKNNVSEKRIAEAYNKLNNTIPIPATSPIDLCINHASRETKTTIAQMPNTECDGKMSGVYGNTVQSHSRLVDANKVGPTDRDGTIIGNQNSSKTQMAHNLPAGVLTPSRNDGAVTVDNILPALNTSNLYIATVPQQGFQNVVLLDSNLTYDTYPTMQTSTHPSMNENAFTPVTKPSNVALYQTTQFTTPTVPMSVSANESTTTVSGPAAKTLNSALHSYNPNKDSGLAQHDVKCSGTDMKCSPVKDKQPNNDSKFGNEFDLDFNSNKSCDRTVVSTVQEKQKKDESKTLETCNKSQLSLEKCSNKEEDEERLEKKRTSIINRKLSHHSDKDPIPLSFTPLSTLGVVADSESLNKTNNIISYEENVIKVMNETEIISNIKILTPEINETNECDGPATVVSNQGFDETQTDETDCRRILLRSSNKLDENLTAQNSKKINGRKTKVRLKDDVTSKKEIISKEKVTSKPRAKKRGSKQMNNTNKNDQSKEKNKKKKVSEKQKNDAKKQKQVDKKLEQNLENSTDLNYLDIEDELLGSKIPKCFDSEETILPGASVSDKIVHYQGNTDSLDMASLEDNVQTEPKAVEAELFDELTQFSCDTVSFENIINEKALLATEFHKESTASMIPVLTSSDVETVLEKEKLSPDNELSTKLKENIGMNTTTLNNVETSIENQREIEIAPISAPDIGLEKTNLQFFKQVISEIEQAKSNKNKQFAEDVQTLTAENRQSPEINKENSSRINSDSCIVLPNESQSIQNSDSSVPQMPKINTHADIPQSYKDSIKIEPLPGASTDPLKKCLRIRLPNGRTFKATVHGRVLLNFDALFDDPSLKSLLLSSLTDKKCYTLNIKQVSTASLENPTKIVETRIQEVQIETKTAPNLIDTINLLSDDEDIEEHQYFKTEFGKYKISPLPQRVFASHQNKLNHQCRVHVIKLDLSQFGDIEVPTGASLTNKFNKTVPIGSINATRVEHKRTIIPTKPPYKPTESEIIEIDDSSNESFVDKKKYSSINHHLTRQMNEYSDIKTSNPLETFTRDCFVKLSKCDDLVKKYEHEKALKLKCFVDLIRMDSIADTISVSATNFHGNIQENYKQQLPSDTEAEVTGRTSPVMEAYDSIANLFNKEVKASQIKLCDFRDTYSCKSLWLETKRILFAQRATYTHEILKNGYGHLEFVRNGFNDILSTRGNGLFNPPDLKTLTLKHFQNNFAVNYCFSSVYDNVKLSHPWKNTSFLLKRKINSVVNPVSNKIPKMNNKRDNCEKNDSMIIESYVYNGDNLLSPKNHEIIIESNLSKEEIDFKKHDPNAEFEVEIEILQKQINEDKGNVKTSDLVEAQVFDDKALSRESNINSAKKNEIFCDNVAPEKFQVSFSKTESNNNTACQHSTHEINCDNIDANITEPHDTRINLNSQTTQCEGNPMFNSKICENISNECEKNIHPFTETVVKNTLTESKDVLYERYNLSQNDDPKSVNLCVRHLESLENENTEGEGLISSNIIPANGGISLRHSPNTDNNDHLNTFDDYRCMIQAYESNNSSHMNIELLQENGGGTGVNNDLEDDTDITQSKNNDEEVAQEVSNCKDIDAGSEIRYVTNTQSEEEITDLEITHENKIIPVVVIIDKDMNVYNNSIALVECNSVKENTDDKLNYYDKQMGDHLAKPQVSSQECVDTYDKTMESGCEKESLYQDLSIFLSNAGDKIGKGDDFSTIIKPDESVKIVEIINEPLQNDKENIKMTYQEDGSRKEDENIDDTILILNKPKNTYINKSKYDFHKYERKSKRIVKRKMDLTNYNYKEKRCRKSKQIDHPKLHNSDLIDTTYGREYKRLFNYCSSVQFSYSRPFHKECIDVHKLLRDWPKSNNTVVENLPENESDQSLFLDLETEEQPDTPNVKTLAEELTHEDYEISNRSSDNKDSNFNMGFGEGSGRVILNLEGGEDVSKISAATLSDVKHDQPVLLSKNDNHYFNRQNSIICKDENQVNEKINSINLYYSSIQLKNKVKSFFEKTANNLKLMRYCSQNKKGDNDFNETMNFPFGLNSPEFINLLPFETTVQVVQIGQLAVSATAQNPVTCDPRVTQVSDASPPQCSAENSPHDGQQTTIKTEYTELTTADITLPMVHDDYDHHEHTTPMESQESSNIPIINETIPIETEIKSVVKIELMEETPDEKMEPNELTENIECEMSRNEEDFNNAVDYSFEATDTNPPDVAQNIEMMYNGTEKSTNGSEEFIPLIQQNGIPEKVDQIAHAMNAAGISTTAEVEDSYSMIPEKISQENLAPTMNDCYSKPAINTMTLQQALAQILPSALSQANGTESNQQVLHIVQGKNASGNQLTLVDNAHSSVINAPNATPVLHIVQNKNATANSTSTASPAAQANTFSGLSLVDAGLQQGGNQLLHIVNTGNAKNNASQLLKRVNLLTNLTNVQGGSEQKMVQFVCKSADGKAIQLNASHQRSMVLRLQPVETPAIQTTSTKPTENQELSPTQIINSADKDAQEIKSGLVYEENYTKFIQTGSAKTTPTEQGTTSLPKFNQAFGKQIYQEDKQNDLNGDSHLPAVTTNSENPECQSQENALNLDHMGQIPSPPLLMRKPSTSTTQSSPNIVQQIKESISPMNIQTMHGGVIYTRQIPVNIGGGQTINLITVPSTEMVDESGQKPQTEVKFVNQSGIEPSIIKIVPQTQPTTNGETSQENNSHIGGTSENNHNPQPQPVLTQMRIKLPMLSKAPQMVSGTRVIRPSFFHIQRNVIGGANQQVYQQLVLTAAPQIGQQTIRLPQPQNATRPHKAPSENQSPSESQMSTSTLEQLREFDLVLEQVKERSTVQPNGNVTGAFSQIPTPSTDTTDSPVIVTSTTTETSQQVLYTANNTQPLNYVNRKTTVTTPTTSSYVRSPDSSGNVETATATSSTSSTSSTPSTSSQASTSHAATTETRSDPPPQPKKHKSKSRPKASSNPPNTLKLNPTPPKTTNQKPLEDEQTTQRILYILAEYKEQVENSPDKDKPAPRRRNNLPTTPSGSSKRKKSRRHGPREMSPIHGDETCRTMGSEDSSCGTSLGDCNESCIDSHSPQDSPRKVVRKLTFEHECIPTPPRPQPQRNVIVADGQTITVARGTAAGKPTAAVLMPTNYLLPLVKGGQQIAIVTNRGPKLLTVTGEGGTTNALLLQRLIGPAGLKPVLARPGFRHVRLPAAALHNLQTFNFTPATPVQPPETTASPAPTPAPPDLVDTRATSSPWTERESQEAKPDRGSSPEASEPWNLHAPVDPHDYSYEETVRTENMDRTVLDPIPDRYSPDMEAQRIFDKMFDVDSKKSYMVDSQDDSPRCGYDIDTSDCDDKAYQVVHKREGTRQHRLTHVSAAALRHKYAILEHELRLQKSLSEECEDLGVDSPSASELFPEAELLFTASPAHDHAQEQGSHSHAPQSTVTCVPQPDIDDQIATDHLIPRSDMNDREDLNIGLEDVGIVTVSEDGTATIALDQEEFARSHPNTTFHSEPTEEGEVQPFTITGLKGRHITSTIFHANRGPGTVLVTTPQTTVISQATAEPAAAANVVKYADIENMIDSLPGGQNNNINVPSVLVKDDSLSSRFDNLLAETRQIRISNATSAIVHSTGNATQVIRRVCYDDDKRPKDGRYVIDEPDVMNAGDDAKMIAEENARDIALGSVATDVEDDRSSPERHSELFWDATAASVRAERRRRLDYSSDSDKCCKSPPTFDEANSTDSNGVGVHNLRLDSVIKVVERTGKADGTIENEHPPLRTYPPKRLYTPTDAELERSLLGKSGDMVEGRRRASVRGVVKRGCHCCNGSPVPPRPKKPRPKKPTMDFTATN